VPTNGVYEFLGKGDGTFAAPNLVLPNFSNFGMADLNHDGLPDIVEYSTKPVEGGFIVPESYSIYLGQPDGSFQFSPTYTPYEDIEPSTANALRNQGFQPAEQFLHRPMRNPPNRRPNNGKVC
jgi:hypothetical protein